jgi:hypothetical protein
MSTTTQLPPGVAPLEEFASRAIDLPWNLETVRCAHVDLAQNGCPTVAVQLDRTSLTFERGLLQRVSDRILLDASHVDDHHLVEAMGPVVRMLRGGDRLWEHDLSARRLGVGLGRNEHDELKVSWKFVGSFRTAADVVAMDWMDLYGDGCLRLVVLTRIARLIVFDEKGEVFARCDLPPGVIGSAVFLPVAPSGSDNWRLVVSMKYHRLRKYQFGSERLEDVSCLLADGKVVDRLDARLVAGPLASPADGYLTEQGGFAIVRGRSFVVAKDDRFRPWRAPERRVSLDPWRNDRHVDLTMEPGRQRLVACALDGQLLWESPLPGTGLREIDVRAAFGAVASGSDDRLAVWLVASRSLGEISATVYQEHLRVFGLDGTLQAAWDGPMSGERDHDTPLLLLDDRSSSSEGYLMVLRRDRVASHRFRLADAQRVGDARAGSVLESLPAFPLPPDDLWERDLLAEAATRGMDGEETP